eukprot:2067283-Amphidinium_carterae.1
MQAGTHCHPIPLSVNFLQQENQPCARLFSSLNDGTFSVSDQAKVLQGLFRSWQKPMNTNTGGRVNHYAKET